MEIDGHYFLLENDRIIIIELMFELDNDDEKAWGERERRERKNRKGKPAETERLEMAST